MGLFFIYIYVCLFPLLCESKRVVTTFYLDPTCSGEPQFREYDAAFDDFCTPSPCQASTIHSFLYRKRECPETYVSLGLDQRSCSSGATNIWRSYPFNRCCFGPFVRSYIFTCVTRFSVRQETYATTNCQEGVVLNATYSWSDCPDNRRYTSNICNTVTIPPTTTTTTASSMTRPAKGVKLWVSLFLNVVLLMFATLL